jgi:hypothetical protein
MCKHFYITHKFILSYLIFYIVTSVKYYLFYYCLYYKYTLLF